MTLSNEELREAIHELLRPIAERSNDDVADHLEDACDDLLALFTQAQLQLLSELKGELETFPHYDRSLFRDGYTDDPHDRREMFEADQVIALLDNLMKGLQG